VNETSSTSPASHSDPSERVLVLAPDENLATAILEALQEAAPRAHVDLAQTLQEAQKIVVHQRPNLFVLDVDATYDLGQEFLYDLRTSHPDARAIVLTAVHLAAQREQAAGMGAIHFLEKPFPHGDFVDLVGALLQPGSRANGEKFQATLSDLHIADIVQLKCMSGATSVLEFTGPRGEKARVYFENGQVHHATAPGKEGVAAFNEIVDWKGGMISEVAGEPESPRTIDRDWQLLLMEAVRKVDERRDAKRNAMRARPRPKPARRKVLVIDDSIMLLNFVQEILEEANYRVVATPTAEEGLRAAAAETPELILLDYVLPDMKGDEVLARLLEEPATANVPVVYMSGFGTDLPSDPNQNPNVIGSLNKPFTSDLLLSTVATHLPSGTNGEEPDLEPAESRADAGSTGYAEAAAGDEIQQSTPVATNDEAWWTAAPSTAPWSENPSEPSRFESQPVAKEAADATSMKGDAFFCGDTSFLSLNWALHAIGSQKLTGTLRSFWDKEPVDLLARNGEIILVTTRDPDLYCPEAPNTLTNIDEEKAAQAREQQRKTGAPFFLTLAEEGAIIRESAMQLLQHYGQKLFAELWTASKVRFVFEESENVPEYARNLPAEGDIDHWTLGTLRFVQFQDLGDAANYDPASIPAYTRDGFERVQNLRLTVAEAQFASQFNGARSIAQIAKNLRLDLKFARLTLFRFCALEIVDCWPAAAVGATQEKRGMFGRLFGR
jgi:DNA-binding response OmpR family regulator